jgi:hypothetical protein
MDSTKLKLLAFLVLASFFAIYLGVAAASAQYEAIAWVTGGAFLGVCLMLGKNVWILIPSTLALQGGVNLLPGMIPPWVFMTVSAGAFFMVRVATGRQRLSFKWTWMETALLLIAITILQAMVRNPVGLRAFGGETAGGKPYFLFAFAFAAYYLINASQPTIKSWRWAVILFMVFGIGDGLIQAVSAIIPEFAQVVGQIYSNVSFDEAMGQGIGYDIGERRFGFLMQIGSILGLITCSFWRPISAANPFKPWRGFVAGLAVSCLFLSGFRSGVAALFFRFCVGSAIRRKGLDVIIVSVMGVLVAVAITGSGNANRLPFGVQRVLTVLPVSLELDERAVSQAENSSQDRFDMWSIVLKSDRYIQNKILGDGFQFSASEINAMAQANIKGSSFSNISFVERSLEVGNYHGFHVETIRFTGIIGLIAATFALFVFAHFAWRTIKFHRNSKIWGYVIFICMPFMIYPYWYWVVFGSFRADFPQLIAMAAMVKVAYDYGLENSMVPETSEDELELEDAHYGGNKDQI